MSLRHKYTNSISFFIMTHCKSEFYHGQEIKAYGLNTWTIHIFSELQLQAIVWFVIKIEIGTHE